MSDKPIIFNDAMVRAILEGRKTQTRRIVKSIDHDLLDMMAGDAEGEIDSDLLGLKYGPSLDDDQNVVPEQWLAFCTECEEEGVMTLGQGYGRPGDLLRVREAHAFVPEPAYRRSTGIYQQINPGDDYEACVYRENFNRARSFPWRPSIHMPRWASRITLEITDVRVERLQDITESEAAAEGCDNSDTEAARECGWYEKPLRAFRRVWEQINGANSWDENPWVWVIEFRPHLMNIDQLLSQRGAA